MSRKLSQIFDDMERQLECSDQYARDNKPPNDFLPSVAELQNSHVRDLIKEARAVLTQGATI